MLAFLVLTQPMEEAHGSIYVARALKAGGMNPSLAMDPGTEPTLGHI